MQRGDVIKTENNTYVIDGFYDSNIHAVQTKVANVHFLFKPEEIENAEIINDSDRYFNNLEIIEKLMDYINKYPMLRFCQLLFIAHVLEQDKNGNVKDPFYQESDETLDKVNTYLK